jgi:hypothetical protein
MDQVMRNEITEMRDLNEHWKDNAPVFNVRPRPGQPKRPTGRAFAARNPAHGPYWWLAWDNQVGPKLSPNVPAAAVHELLDRVEARVLNDYPDLAEFIPRLAQVPGSIILNATGGSPVRRTSKSSGHLGRAAAGTAPACARMKTRPAPRHRSTEP